MKLSLILVAIVACTVVQAKAVNKRQESFFERVQDWVSNVRDNLANAWQRIRERINSFDVDALEENLRGHADRLSEGTNEHISNIITAIRNVLGRNENEIPREEVVEEVRDEAGLGEDEVPEEDLNFVVDAVEEAAGSDEEGDGNEEEAVTKRQGSFLERIRDWASGIRDNIANVWQRIQDHINSFDVSALEENLRAHADRLSEGTNEHISNIITAIRNAVENAQSELQRDDLVDQVREETGLEEAEVPEEDINLVADAVEEAAENAAPAAESEEE